MDERQFTMGDRVRCRDGECGEIIRVVLDPVARSVTHVVVEPTHRQGLGRLVPLGLIDDSNDEVVLQCSRDEFDNLTLAEETDFLPGYGASFGYDPGAVVAMPYFGLGPGVTSLPVTYDKVPLGEVAVRRGEPVHATDGEIGRVQGLVIDSRDHHVTHVLLQEGHLWDREEVAIPISAVVGIESGIQLNLTKQQVQDLAPIAIEHPHD